MKIIKTNRFKVLVVLIGILIALLIIRFRSVEQSPDLTSTESSGPWWYPGEVHKPNPPNRSNVTVPPYPVGQTCPPPDEMVCQKLLSPAAATCRTLQSKCASCGGDGSMSADDCTKLDF